MMLNLPMTVENALAIWVLGITLVEMIKSRKFSLAALVSALMSVFKH